MPSFCRPERLECRLRRANVEIPPSSPLNTRVNNSAQPEQSLNLRVCRALLCTLYFLSPSHKKEQRVGHCSLCSSLTISLLYDWIFSPRPEFLLLRVFSDTPACHPPADLWVVLHDNTSGGGVEGGGRKKMAFTKIKRK